MSTAADLVFDDIVRDILLGSIRPRDRISERDLVARFGVSRTPVREALKRLFERGLVDSGPKGVAIVAEIGGEDLRNLYDLRVQLESYAATLTATNISSSEIDELNRINKKFDAALTDRDLIRMLDVRAEFHALTVEVTRNRWLAQVLIMLRNRAYAVRHLHWQDADRAAQTRLIHDQMIDALRRHDANLYRDLVVQQISAAIDCYENQLRARPRAASSPLVTKGRGSNRLQQESAEHPSEDAKRPADKQKRRVRTVNK